MTPNDNGSTPAPVTSPQGIQSAASQGNVIPLQRGDTKSSDAGDTRPRLTIARDDEEEPDMSGSTRGLDLLTINLDDQLHG